MSIEKKISIGTALLLGNLKKECDTVIETSDSADHEITLSEKTLLEGYTTTLKSGEEVAVTVREIEAVDNFRHDFQNATRLFVGDHGHEHMTKHEGAESFRATFNLGETGMSVQSAFFRPGKEDQGNTNFVSITDSWVGSEEDKAIEAHLKGLSRKLAKDKK